MAGTCQLSVFRNQPEASDHRLLASAILLSLVLHGLLIVLIGGNTWVRDAGRLRGDNVMQSLLHVNLVNARSLNQVNPSNSGQPAVSASVSDEVEAPVPVVILPGEREEIVVGKGAAATIPPASMPVQKAITGAIESTPLLRGKGEATDGEKILPEGYLPRDQLSAPPMPLQEIRIPWPPGLPALGKQSAIFTVFIDEIGVVREMVPDGPTLAPIMVETARQAFMSTRFRPAQAGGLSVKAMLRIEVIFELETMPAGPPAANKPGTIVEQRML